MATTRLDFEIYRRQLTNSRNQARELILNHQVLVNSIIAQKPGANVSKTDDIVIIGNKYVSRAAYKLVGILDSDEGIELKQKIVGAKALDIGASTGGFTQVLLEYGAQQVTALDVGSSQLSEALVNNKRVINLAQTNIRNYQELFQPKAFDIIVCDVSFISLTQVVPAIEYLLRPNSVAIVLIKPQFELGKNVVQNFKNGIITDVKLHRRAIEIVSNCARNHSLAIQYISSAVITGSSGNQEYITVMCSQMS